MDKYEYRVKSDQIMEHMSNKEYKRALEIAETIDWRRVKNPSMLNTVSEIYELNGDDQKARELLYVAYDRAPGSRKIVYRLGILALKIHDVAEAADCYEEFVKIAPKDSNQYILKYKILKEQNAPLADQIATLEEYKKAEYTEKWAYELARLYEQAGMTAKCLEECDDLILWFSDGKYVLQAMDLKRKYKPLTPLQQDKYDHAQRGGAVFERSRIAKSLTESVNNTTSLPIRELAKEEEHQDLDQALAALNSTDHFSSRVSDAEYGATRRVPTSELSKAIAQLQADFDKDGAAEEPKTIVTASAPKETVTGNVAVAGGLHIEGDKMAERSEQLKQTGQLMIEDILMEWENKQKQNAEAIAKQKKEDEERLNKEKQELEAKKEERRKEEERLEALEVERREEERRAKEKEKEAEAFDTGAMLGLMPEEEIEEQKAAQKAAQGEDYQLQIDFMEEETTGEESEFEEIDLDEDIDIDEEILSGDELDEDELDEDELDEDELDEDELDEDEFDEDEFDEDEFDDEDDFDHGHFDDDESEEDEFDEEFFENDEEDEFEEDISDDVEDEDPDGDDEFEDEDEFDISGLEEIVATESKNVMDIEEPSEEEIQKRIRKSKGGVPFDTGFVVTGRYDLSATSEIGLKAGLTEEQKKLFSYFVPVRGMSEQIVEVLDNDRRAQREGTSKCGNLLVIGQKGSGKTVLAVDIVKAIQKQRNLKQGKVAIVTGDSLNKKELPGIFQKLKGGAIIVEKAGKLNSRTIKELNYLMEKKTGELIFVLEDERKPLERILTVNPSFKKKFNSKLELPEFINDELVTFGQAYAKENGYKLDEMGILALYSRIDVMQREDHAVTVAEVKEIMDEAITHSQKANVKHLARRVFGKSTDGSDRIILKEEDFRI